LDEVEIPTSFVVRDIRGNVFYDEGKPLQGACIEIVNPKLKVGEYMNYADKEGRFEVRTLQVFFVFWRDSALPAGTYRFKVTKEGFYPTVGTVVVSPKAPKQSDMQIELKPDNNFLVRRGTELVPNEHLIPEAVVPVTNAHKEMQFPERYAAVYTPVSLAVGRIRTSEFPVEKGWYQIMLQLDNSLPSRELTCMLGGPSFLGDCGSTHSLLRADWTVWDRGEIVYWGSTKERSTCIWSAKDIFACLGTFPAEAGRKYIVQVHFTEDGTPLKVANPRLLVIKHEHIFNK
jgi:hypothetical protein